MIRVSLPRRAPKPEGERKHAPSTSIDKIRKAAIDAHLPLIEEAAPWNIGRTYGSSYFVDPRGNVVALGSEDKDELVVAEMDFDMLEDVRRVRQFHRDRRPETYGSIAEQLP